MSDEALIALMFIGYAVDMTRELLAGMSRLEMVGAASGVLGTALLALHNRWSGWGFVAYLVSNAAWILFALEHSHGGLLLQQAAFTLFALVGVWRWLVVPGWNRLGDWLDEALDWGDTP